MNSTQLEWQGSQPDLHQSFPYHWLSSFPLKMFFPYNVSNVCDIKHHIRDVIIQNLYPHLQLFSEEQIFYFFCLLGIISLLYCSNSTLNMLNLSYLVYMFILSSLLSNWNSIQYQCQSHPFCLLHHISKPPQVLALE